MAFIKDPIEWEKGTIKKMVHIYCKSHHGMYNRLCPECSGLLEYANKRLDKCKFGSKKSTCEKCPVHCYKPEKREYVKQVMRYAGPKMILKHPIDAVRHIIKNIK